jgi:hypothetical protein
MPSFLLFDSFALILSVIVSALYAFAHASGNATVKSGDFGRSSWYSIHRGNIRSNYGNLVDELLGLAGADCIHTESSSRGAKRRGDPGAVRRPPFPWIASL